jgi:hypothetical protein
VLRKIRQCSWHDTEGELTSTSHFDCTLCQAISERWMTNHLSRRALDSQPDLAPGRAWRHHGLTPGQARRTRRALRTCPSLYGGCRLLSPLVVSLPWRRRGHAEDLLPLTQRLMGVHAQPIARFGTPPQRSLSWQRIRCHGPPMSRESPSNHRTGACGAGPDTPRVREVALVAGTTHPVHLEKII